MVIILMLTAMRNSRKGIPLNGLSDERKNQHPYRKLQQKQNKSIYFYVRPCTQMTCHSPIIIF